MQTYDDWFYSQFPGGKAGVIWNKSGVDLISITDTGNLEMQSKQLQYFFQKLEVDFIGEGAVEKLNQYGYKNAYEIIIDPNILTSVVGENGRKAAEILKTKLKATTPQLFFAALGLFGRGMGERKLRSLFSKFDLDQILSGKVTVGDICAVEGFDIKSATVIVENVPNAKNQFKKIKNYVNFVKVTEKVLGDGVFKDEVIVATGVRLSAEQIEKIETLGGEVSDSLNKNTTLLVCKDPSSNSGKAVKAKDMGIKVISLNDLLTMIG